MNAHRIEGWRSGGPAAKGRSSSYGYCVQVGFGPSVIFLSAFVPYKRISIAFWADQNLGNVGRFRVGSLLLH